MGSLNFSCWFCFCRLQAVINILGYMTTSAAAGAGVSIALHHHASLAVAWSRLSASHPFAWRNMAASWIIVVVFSFVRVLVPLVWTRRGPPESTVGTIPIQLRKNLFGKTMFDGDVVLMLSEAVGITFLQKVAIKYRLGRVLVTTPSLELRDEEATTRAARTQ